MGEERPWPWERSYPPGVRWDAPLAISTLPQMLDVFTAQWGPKPALEYRDRTTTYAELRTAVDAVAAGLMDLGVGPGTAVALYLPNTPYHPITFFAVLKCGGRVVHLSPLDAERELAFKLKDSGARILVTTNIGFMALMARKLMADGLLDRLIVGDDTAFGPSALPTTPIPDDAGIVRFDALREAGAGTLPREWPRIDVEDIALLQYTGGTTGKPKGTILTHANLSAASAIYKAWSDPQRDLGARGGQGALRPAAVPHVRAQRGHAPLPVRGQRADAQAALRRGHHAARHRGQARHHLPRRAHDVDRARQHARRRAARLLLAAPRQLGRCAAARGGGGAVREAHRPAPRRWLGHDRDVAGGHQPSERVDRQVRLGGHAAARHHDGHRGARRPAPAAASGREGRDPHQGAERHPGVLERAAGDGGGVRRRLSADRRHRHHGRGRLLLSWWTARRT